MCEFCVSHGDGEKWYLQAKNYSDDLLSDIGRQKFIKEFTAGTSDEFPKILEKLKKLSVAPAAVKWLVKGHIKRKMKREHHGQVVPLEEVNQIIDMMSTIVRVPCLCRRELCKEDKYYCLSMILSPNSLGMGAYVDESLIAGPGGNGLEVIEKDAAKELLIEFEKEALCHTVWTFMSPFIGGICNCDRSDCMAMISSVTHSLPILYKGEYVAQPDVDSCNGCRACMGMCQFGAIGYSATTEKIFIDPHHCYGCGICRIKCQQKAITLVDRKSHPVAALSWV